MSAEADRIQGQAKEAAGVITGNKDLESEGQADRRAGEAKEKVGRAKSTVEGAVNKAADTVDQVIEKTKQASHRK